MMMKKLCLAGLVIGACLASPAMALEHEVVIEHDRGAIAADYQGVVSVETRQIGTAGVAGRPSSLRCIWTASLNVERTAMIGETLQSRRLLSSDDVASGSRPGWCGANAKAIDRLVDLRRETFRTAMLALAGEDRTALLAEADGVGTKNREG
ncbi:MAG: hypothetical protein RQ806_03170 [Erythrobacter sp.]|nr:hypothetical protein [Erythrobacter sp.]